MRIRLLGEVGMELNGKALPAAQMSGRARELLCFLALDPGPHPRGELATRFWPDVLDQSARASLRTALHGLRRALAGADRYLHVTRDRIGLDEGARVDVRAVAELAEGGRVHEALALCDGELLSGIGSEWAVHARDEHHDLVRDLHEQLAADAEARGDLDSALRSTREQIALDPLSEESNRRLIRRFAVAGDRPAALAVYSRLEERLRVELGVAPSAMTRQLAAEMRTGRFGGGTGQTARSRSEPEAVAALDEALGAYVDAVGAIAAAVDRLDGADAGEWLEQLAAEPGRIRTKLALSDADAPNAKAPPVVA